MNILLVDHSNTLMRSLHVHTKLYYGDYFTGGVYGYIQQLASAIEKFQIDKVVVCKDKTPYKRKEIYKEYKGDRQTFSDLENKMFQDSILLAERFLAISGFPILVEQGYEADDLIAALQKQYTKENHTIYIRSSDDDLFQLLDKNTILLRNKGKAYNLRTYNRDYKFPVKDWNLYNALKGGHNNLKGLKNIGPKKAAALVLNEDALEKVYLDNKTYLDMALSLIELPFEDLKVQEIQQQKFKRIKYIIFLQSLGIEGTSFLTNPFTKFSGVIFK